MTFALKAKDIRKSFGGIEVLHGLDLEATGGSVLALLGENGAGKSTLVKIIAGDYTADSGDIVIDDLAYPSLTPITARDLGVAIIFQEFQDAPTLTVAENISLGRLPNRFGVIDWKAGAFFLERRHADRWRNKTESKVVGADGGPVEFVFKVVRDDAQPRAVPGTEKQTEVAS